MRLPILLAASWQSQIGDRRRVPVSPVKKQDNQLSLSFGSRHPPRVRGVAWLADEA